MQHYIRMVWQVNLELLYTAKPWKTLSLKLPHMIDIYVALLIHFLPKRIQCLRNMKLSRYNSLHTHVKIFLNSFQVNLSATHSDEITVTVHVDLISKVVPKKYQTQRSNSELQNNYVCVLRIKKNLLGFFFRKFV